MLPTYEVLPHCGIGLRLRMARAEARRCMPGPPTEFRKTATGPWVDAWHECGLQAFDSDAGTIEFLEVSRGAVDARLRGIRVFDTDVDEVVRRLRAEADIDEDDPELPYSYVFPGWDLALWRQFVPEDPDDTEGRRFDTVGVGMPGYYSEPAN